MRFDPSHDVDRHIRNETDAADHLAAFLTPDAEVTLHAKCPTCGGTGTQLTATREPIGIPCPTCDGTGEISGRVPLRELLKAMGVITIKEMSDKDKKRRYYLRPGDS